ncbi:MAG TPA: CPXCG motif-containing cysteine-rich protein [Gammaproteobacteria bacterium]
MLEHRTVTCPYCWQAIELALDPSVDAQEYVEDCSVCCRPIAIRVRRGEDGLELDVAPENP